MAAGKRKAEGIALLSLYYDEGDDEEDEDDEDEGEEEENHDARQDIEQNPEKKLHELEEGEAPEETVTEKSVTTVVVSVSSSETLVSVLPDVSVKENDSVMHSPVAERPANGARGIFVDYAHDEGALSPDAEEGEIMTSGRAILASGANVSNGFVQGVTPPSLVPQESKQPEEQSPQFMLELTPHSDPAAAPTTDLLNKEMVDAETQDKQATETDSLADFLPPPPTTTCSEELQNKFLRFLGLKNSGKSFNDALRQSKGYRNPDFLQHAVKHQEIDQIGSCFSKEIFDPHGYDPSDFYDALALELKREQERKEQAKKQNQRVDFIHGGVQAAPVSDQPPAGSQPANASEAAPKSETARSNKKSKWDKVDTEAKLPALLPTVGKSAIMTATAHTAFQTASAGGGYQSFVLQKRKEAEERSRGIDRKLDRKG